MSDKTSKYNAEEKTADQAIRDEETTAQDVMKAQRCAIPLELYQDISTIATAAMKDHCEVQIQAVKEYVARQKLLSDCKNGEVRGDVCKCVGA